MEFDSHFEMVVAELEMLAVYAKQAQTLLFCRRTADESKRLNAMLLIIGKIACGKQESFPDSVHSQKAESVDSVYRTALESAAHSWHETKQQLVIGIGYYYPLEEIYDVAMRALHDLGVRKYDPFAGKSVQ